MMHIVMQSSWNIILTILILDAVIKPVVQPMVLLSVKVPINDANTEYDTKNNSQSIKSKNNTNNRMIRCDKNCIFTAYYTAPQIALFAIVLLIAFYGCYCYYYRRIVRRFCPMLVNSYYHTPEARTPSISNWSITSVWSENRRNQEMEMRNRRFELA